MAAHMCQTPAWCVVFVALAACGGWDLEPPLTQANLPQVPAGPVHDYEPLAGMAHAALPLFDAVRGQFTGPGRIWLKGSIACRAARIVETGQVVPLDPPYYAAVVEAPAGTATVAFETAGPHARSVRVAVPDAALLNAARRPFSALFFGDFQPFVIDGGRVNVNPGPRDSLVALRELLRAAADGTVPGFPRPLFACGIGDQVYVEGDYHRYPEYGLRHPMSAWTVEAQPRPRVGLGSLPRFLDVCYRAHWSFTTLEAALRSCPAVMTWDDHDIRDGWGSHGDEHVYRDSYFRVFREAFVAHQLQRGPRPFAAELARRDAPLWQSFTVCGVPVFLLDLRTCRDVSVPAVMGSAQWDALRAWFASLDPARSRHYVLVSSVPIFYRVGDRANIAAAFTDEVRDDLLDTWTSAPNQAEWRDLVAEIAAAGARGLRGVVFSGDYHLNSLCRVTASRDGAGPATIAYELVVSGLAAESFGDWKQEMAREGSFLGTPIETDGWRLALEFALAEPCAAFAGLEFGDGGVFASLFQSSAAGTFQTRVPLSFEADPGRLDTAVRRGRKALGAAAR
jgi:hypothetical protein